MRIPRYRGSKYQRDVKRRLAKKRAHRKRNYVNTLVVRGPTIVPDQMFVKMTFKYNVFDQEPNGAFTTQVIRANSIFEPNFGASGQPLGRDEWQNFYGQYQVMGSKIRVEYLPRTEQGTNFNIVLIPTLDPSPSGIAQLQESPYAKSALCSSQADTPKTLRCYMKSAAMFGTKDILSEEDTAASMAANPDKVWYWVVGTANNLLGQTGQKALDLQIKVEFYVRLFDRKQLERS